MAVIARLQYEDVAQYLLTVFEQQLTMYDQLINAPSSSNGQHQLQVLAIEGRLSWLTHMVAAVIGASQAAPDPRKGQAGDPLSLRSYYLTLTTLPSHTRNYTNQHTCSRMVGRL